MLSSYTQEDLKKEARVKGYKDIDVKMVDW